MATNAKSDRFSDFPGCGEQALELQGGEAQGR